MVNRASLDKRPDEVATMFDDVAPKYDVVNDVLSMGQTRRWRKVVVEAMDVRAGQRVLDVACGQGNAAMAAARYFAEATGVDYAANLLAQGRERAAVEHLPVTFTEGDAENLPCADASFDLTVSTVGVMFAPDHQRAADELVRVTRSGGKIALASWTPTGMIGQLFKTVASWAPPPAGVRPATLWGTTCQGQ